MASNATATKPTGKLRWDNVMTVGSAAIIIATEAFATAIAAAWAIAGLFSLGDIGEYALMGLFSLAAAYVTLLYIRKASEAEPLRG